MSMENSIERDDLLGKNPHSKRDGVEVSIRQTSQKKSESDTVIDDDLYVLRGDSL